MNCRYAAKQAPAFGLAHDHAYGADVDASTSERNEEYAEGVESNEQTNDISASVARG